MRTRKGSQKLLAMSFSKLFRNKSFYSVTLSVVLSVMFVALAVSAATTISTNITTGGTLTVTGISTFTGAVYATSSVVATGQLRTYDQLILDSATSDPTGAAAGALYWNTTNSLIRLYDGANWRTVATSTSGSDGLTLTGPGVRFNTIATGYMALGTTTLPAPAADANGLLFLNATTSATVPLVIVGASGSQTGDLFRVLNPTFTELFAIDAYGNASTSVISTATGAGLFVGGYATTTGPNGNFATEGTLAVTGTSAHTGNATFAGNVTLGNAAADLITITGNASSTAALTVVGTEFSVGGYATTTVSLANAAATTTLGSALGSALGIGTTTPAFSAKLGVVGSIHAGSTATTSLILHTNTASTGTCIQMVASDGTMIKIYATSTPGANANGQSLRVEAGACLKTN
ncbi:MAG: hypothetical protein HYT46_01905 [Candidatus Vogelbacteria bacterium]|nr:hypothetical protein [Candidatus Vogelbacteria bacterium]